MQELENKKSRPKWLFGFKHFSFFIFILFLFLFCFYVLAFLTFVSSQQDWITSSTFTIKGFYLLLSALPWTLFFFSIFMIFAASIISRKYSLSYKKPFIFTLIFIIFILTFTNFVFTASGARGYLKEEAFKRGIKLAPNNLLDLRKDIQEMRIYEVQ